MVKQVIITNVLQAISSDITRITYEGGHAYLCAHKDIFGQVVYGWSVGLTMEAGLVLNSLRQAVATIQTLFGVTQLPPDLIWHQDQGSQYTSYEYVEAVLPHGRISYSRPGTPTDNPGQESFFGRLKEEYGDLIAECATFEELEQLLSKLIKKYNHERLHTSIGYKTPMEFLKSFL